MIFPRAVSCSVPAGRGSDRAQRAVVSVTAAAIIAVIKGTQVPSTATTIGILLVGPLQAASVVLEDVCPGGIERFAGQGQLVFPE